MALSKLPAIKINSAEMKSMWCRLLCRVFFPLLLSFWRVTARASSLNDCFCLRELFCCCSFILIRIDSLMLIWIPLGISKELFHENPHHSDYLIEEILICFGCVWANAFSNGIILQIAFYLHKTQPSTLYTVKENTQIKCDSTVDENVKNSKIPLKPDFDCNATFCRMSDRRIRSLIEDWKYSGKCGLTKKRWVDIIQSLY